MSRKTIAFVVALLGSVLTALTTTFGLGINAAAIAIAVGAFLVYIFLEGKLDLKLLKAQPGKWKDPKFWLAIISGVLVAVEESFGLGIPVEVVVSFVTAIMGLLFAQKFNTEQPY